MLTGMYLLVAVRVATSIIVNQLNALNFKSNQIEFSYSSSLSGGWPSSAPAFLNLKRYEHYNRTPHQMTWLSNIKKSECVSFILLLIPLKFSSTVLYNSVRHASVHYGPNWGVMWSY